MSVPCATTSGRRWAAALYGALRRTMAAGFTLSDTVTAGAEQAEGEALLRPVDSLFRDRPAYVLPTPWAVARCRNGNPVSVTEPLPEGEYRVYDPEGDFLCLSRLEGGVLTSIKNFFRSVNEFGTY